MYSFKQSEWYDVYYSQPDPSPVYTERKLYENLQGKVYIKNVQFYEIGDKGVIKLNSADLQSLISTSSFENSTNSGNGGSIYRTRSICYPNSL
ncbi:hypothetical protein TVAG_459600 [Trichomonas vaginalis G3]|uniref:Uncharacterized protein n=1 Tax=Trichomonas vaginalis (strain ATCC PRA-98 / G3) TaxID=412133 RepID=A2FHM0_TRIV3|nr:hypothetical protein TVAGG3_0741870 [Trichomonas vaginalis G3]EAX95611.1 hypothetical protein TVAG_459600 [Trichomonas vaginalis G3]KAI5511939.1 hypothetical protein TVAGG3_0741870 [Trichomonas vaginalis G3]|eukprot:XP_001308541.1 hypothetical protein [Trichomonas vaginalis G3]